MTSRILISACQSNSGKTTLTMGLIKAALLMGKEVCSFKSGPDYIDPLFHKEALRVPSYNLDLFLMGEDYVKDLLKKKTHQADMTFIEGAMGYYDGIGTGSQGSAWDLARTTKTPSILILAPKGLAASLGAMVKGYLTYKDPSMIKGFILNKVSPMMFSYYKKIIQELTDIPVLGFLPNIEDISLESRYLGLLGVDEIEDIEGKIDRLGRTLLETVDMEALFEIGRQAKDLEPGKSFSYKKPDGQVLKLGLAQDKALSFYYPDVLESLEEAGWGLEPFSILEDPALPEGISALYLGGGYPESYAEAISNNQSLLEDIKNKYQEGLPILAEGGGYMVLQESYREGEKTYPWIGLLPGEVQLTDRLQNFGYGSLSFEKDHLLGTRDKPIKSHEFHYSRLDREGEDILTQKPQSRKNWKSGQVGDHLFASYSHLHLASDPDLMDAFISRARQYKGEEDV
ncbi:MAG: cobyrinate a,c-diamide synthase [Tissierellia bacterium]|nr:cobyrinate a,c-diamide synthase [Tissierellia bacterium]